MFKLMVVDDEKIVIDAVNHIVKNELGMIQISDTARSGREAIEKARLQRPDIILMDIRMPGINGLETIKEIKKIHNNVKFVIVSAYEYFEFAKQAVELEVKEYLLKPVNKARLVEVLEKIVRQLTEERRQQDQELETREKIEKMMSVVGHGFIYSLLLSQKADIGKYKELFEIDSESGYIFILTYKRRQSAVSRVVCLGESAQNQKFYTYFNDQIKYKCKCIIGPAMLDRVVVYVGVSGSNLYRQRVSAISLLETIVQKLENKFNIEFRAGIGGVHSDDEILISYQEALKALNYSEIQQITHIDDIRTNADGAGYEMLTEEKHLIDAVERGDAGHCVNLLTDIFGKYTNIFENEGLKNRFLEIMVVAHRIAIEHGIKSDEYIEYSKYIKQILSCNDQHSFEQMYIKKISYIAEKINDTKRNKVSSVVDAANQIIHTRFDQELTLDGISKELCISPQYFSRLYKDEMGINFIESLTAVRVEHAKKLMKKGEYTIKEICYLSGYSDPNYFSRLFKKHEGISPSTFLKQL